MEVALDGATYRALLSESVASSIPTSRVTRPNFLLFYFGFSRLFLSLSLSLSSISSGIRVAAVSIGFETNAIARIGSLALINRLSLFIFLLIKSESRNRFTIVPLMNTII